MNNVHIIVFAKSYSPRSCVCVLPLNTLSGSLLTVKCKYTTFSEDWTEKIRHAREMSPGRWVCVGPAVSAVIMLQLLSGGSSIKTELRILSLRSYQSNCTALAFKVVVSLLERDKIRRKMHSNISEN